MSDKKYPAFVDGKWIEITTEEAKKIYEEILEIENMKGGIKNEKRN